MRPFNVVVFLSYLLASKLSLTFHLSEVANSIAISDVIIQIIQNHMVPWANPINFVFQSQNRQSMYHQRDIINNVLSMSDNSKMFRIEQPDYIEHYLRAYNVLMADTYESFMQIYRGMNATTYVLQGLFAVVITNTTSGNLGTIRKIFQEFWKISVVDVILITQREYEDIIDFYTYFPFASTHCREVVPIVFNSFKEGLFVRHVPAFPKKLDNFHGCPLNVVTWHLMPFVSLTYFDNGTIFPDGIDGKLLRVLSQIRNFSISIEIPQSRNKRGEVFENGTATGAIQMITEGDGDFTICGYGFTTERALHMSATVSYLSADMVFAVSLHAPYSSFEKLFFPFDPLVWTMIFAMLVVGLVAITVLKLFGENYIDFVAGHQNTSASIHMFSIFLGGSVPNTPQRNFARTLLFLWIVVTLVIRSSYQGSMFKYLKSREVPRKERSPEQLINDSYKIYFWGHHTFIINMMQLTEDQYLLMEGNVSKYYQLLYKPGFKGIILDTELGVRYNNALNRDKPSIRPLDKHMFAFPMSIFCKKNSYLPKAFDGVLLNFIGSGLVLKWAAEILNRPYDDAKLRNPEHKSISFEDVVGCFQICGVLGVVSILIFLFEINAMRWNFLRKLMDFLTY